MEWQVLASDPADDPASHSGVLQSIEVDDDEKVEDDDVFKIAAPKGVQTKNKAKNQAVASGIMNKNIPTMGAAKAQPEQRLGCPQCMKGELVQKRRDTFRFRETILVCEKVWNSNAKQVGGGCGYTMEINSEPLDGIKNKDDDGDADADSVSVTKVDKATNAAKTNKNRVSKREKTDMDELVAQERENGMQNPHAAAIMVGPPTDKFKEKPKEKIVVDLTSDDELLGIASPPKPTRKLPTPMIGAHAPIVIDDDETKPAAEFDELGSEDELQLIQLADKAEDARDELDEDDELELIEMTDKAAATMAPR
jgi:hypothetical protein